LHDPGVTLPHLQGYAAMGTLDDAIREHLELKRRLGASDEELEEKETEAFGASGAPARPAPPSADSGADAPAETAKEPEFQVQRTASPPEDSTAGADPWEPPGSDEDLLGPDEALPQDATEPNGSHATRAEPAERLDPDRPEEPHEDPLDEWEGEPEPTEDVLRETPEFLEETPEHDRLWFEQKPPKDFDF
jgi:hypothetical protein